RRQREALTDPGNRYEYLDPAAGTAQSASGAGRVGFAGTLEHETGSAVTGLTTLTDSTAGPAVPMLPHTWEGPGG
ncbi:MAG: PPE family protein, partial [Actinomycetota bacterium]|nr:PPE family protein [Actinomycetota bacterium]